MRLQLFALVTLLCPLGSFAAENHWIPSKTPDGQPDLQGTWTNATITPFERPAELADKPVLTPEEAAQVERDAYHRQAEIDSAYAQVANNVMEITRLQEEVTRLQEDSDGDD